MAGAGEVEVRGVVAATTTRITGRHHSKKVVAIHSQHISIQISFRPTVLDLLCHLLAGYDLRLLRRRNTAISTVCLRCRLMGYRVTAVDRADTAGVVDIVARTDMRVSTDTEVTLVMADPHHTHKILVTGMADRRIVEDKDIKEDIAEKACT